MDVFDLFAKISLDKSEYEEGLDDASKKSSKIGDSIKDGLGIAAKTTVAAISAASVAIGVLVKDSVEAFANYEQLVGGVETLFKDSASVVMEYANNAYISAGLSANEYMETVTSFSASLIASLGGDTEAAAQIADVAITDMADNANKMGSSIESIQNAYQGFAKQNYTMLDNLKLGYGGTKTEMERLLADATKISGIKYNIDSYSDVVNAIHVMQEEMGIAGTTAEEASETISGSFGMVAASWENLVVGLADGNADIGSLVDNLISSAETAFSNVLPVIERALYGIADFADTILPIIAEKLPSLVLDLTPKLFDVALNLVTVLGNGILQNLPAIIETAFALIMQLADGLTQALPTLVPAIVSVVLSIVDNILDNLDMLIDASIGLIMALAEGLIASLPILIEKAPEIVEKLVDALSENAPQLLVSALELIYMLAEGIVKNLPYLILTAAKIVFSIVQGIANCIGQLFEKGKELVDKVAEGFSEKVENAKTWGKDLIDNFVNGIKEAWDKLKDTVVGVAQSIADVLGFSEPKEGPLSNFHTYAPDMIDLWNEGIEANEGKIQAQIAKSFDFADTIIANGNLSSELEGSVNISSVTANNTEDVEEIGNIIAMKVAEALENISIELDGRNLGRAVREYA